jgi:hypothetical protein
VSEYGAAYGKHSDFFARDHRSTQTTFFTQLVRKHKFAIDLVSVSNFGVQGKHLFFQKVFVDTIVGHQNRK